MAIDFQGLFKVLKASEERPEERFRMSAWKCGSAGCMIGSFCEANPEDELKLAYVRPDTPVFVPVLHGDSGGSISRRFGISSNEAMFLFIKHYGKCPNATALTQQQALTRLRKFIYYKLHKQEMIVEEGRNKRIVHHGRDIAGRASVCHAAEMARCG